MRETLNTIIFGTKTPAGKFFDLALIWAIVISVVLILLATIDAISEEYRRGLYMAEWVFTILFTIEYALRIYSARDRKQYIFSFYGVVDLLSILPLYISLIFPQASYLLVIRLLRVLRIFRVLKLLRYMKDANLLLRSLWHSRRKIMVFFGTVLIMCVIIGSVMYAVEGPENGFTSIPKSIYWTIVTITTVGYGDITPQTNFGQGLAAATMLLGYSIIAVPTGIITSQMASELRRDTMLLNCLACGRGNHETEARFCLKCGAELPNDLAEPEDDVS
ncbi:ion transporter [Biformimicrobium ophioploci]|uniref:Ion transporter n=2 Tax=Biformimicrobium ophioploci TaxID=3036711 RepID=A0ABQ6M187_9GAMM|nr:ion transporter [Microbulbifer sp. NKW57]